MERIEGVNSTNLLSEGLNSFELATSTGETRKVKLRDTSFQLIKNATEKVNDTPAPIKEKATPVDTVSSTSVKTLPSMVTMLEGRDLVVGRILGSTSKKALMVKAQITSELRIAGKQSSVPQKEDNPAVEEVKIVSPERVEEKVAVSTPVAVKEVAVPVTEVALPKTEDTEMGSEMSSEMPVVPQEEISKAIEIADKDIEYQNVIEKQKEVISLKNEYQQKAEEQQAVREQLELSNQEKTESEKARIEAIEAEKEALLEFQKAIHQQKETLTKEEARLKKEMMVADQEIKETNKRISENAMVTEGNKKETETIRNKVTELRDLRTALIGNSLQLQESKGPEIDAPHHKGRAA